MSLFQPALLAGIVIGVLSALPVVSAGNCCCCMWVVGGGALAAWLLQQNTTRGITPAEGMLVGLIAGVVGAIVGLPVGLASQALLGQIVDHRELLDRFIESAGSLPPEIHDALIQARDSSAGLAQGPARVVLSFFVSLGVNLVFATLGGLLGAVFFRKDTDAPLSTIAAPAEPPAAPPPSVP
jgi:hypothetical protein